MATTNTKHALLDTLIERLKVPNDAALAHLLEMHPPTISRMRHRKLKVGDSALLRMHEASGMAFSEMRALAAA